MKFQSKSSSNKHLDSVNQNQDDLHQPASKQASNASCQKKSLFPLTTSSIFQTVMIFRIRQLGYFYLTFVFFTSKRGFRARVIIVSSNLNGKYYFLEMKKPRNVFF